MADEEKKLPLQATGKRKAREGIANIVDDLGSKTAKRSRSATGPSSRKDNDDNTVATFLPSLMQHHMATAPNRAQTTTDDSEAPLLQQIVEAKKPPAKKPFQTQETLQDGLMSDFLQRYNPPIRLNVEDQPNQSAHPHPVARATTSNRLGLQTISGELPRPFPLGGIGFSQSLDSATRPSLHNIPNTQTLPSSTQAASRPTPLTNSRLNELLVATAIQVSDRRFPPSAAATPNPLSLALSSLQSRAQNPVADALSATRRPGHPYLATQFNRLTSQIQLPGLSGGLIPYGFVLGQFTAGIENPATPATGNSNPYLDILQSSRSAGRVPCQGDLSGFLPSQIDTSRETLLARLASPHNVDAGARIPQHEETAVSSSSAGTSSSQSQVRILPIYSDRDELCLSKFQCLARKQIELFEASEADVQVGARGRNTPIVLGQVGIRCRHCAHLPHQARKKGHTYYPTKFDRVYQTAVNMASIHFCQHCPSIPHDIRKELLNLKDRHKSIVGGGKEYWASGVKMLGIVEGEGGLKFPATAKQKDSQSS